MQSILRSFALAAAGLACLAVGPCAPAPVATCFDGTAAPAGGCPSESDTLDISLAPPLVPEPETELLFATLGYVSGGGLGFEGPNLEVPTSFSGGTDERFNAVAVYPATSPVFEDPRSPGSFVDPSGYIVAAGFARNPSRSVVTLIARYTPDGFLDTTFNRGKGYVLGADAGFVGGDVHQITGVAIDSFGRIVVSGFGWSALAATGRRKGFVARYNADGSLDTTFHAYPIPPASAPLEGSAQNGYAVSPFDGYGGLGATTDDKFLGLTVDPVTDEIIAVGYVRLAAARFVPLLVRFSSDGTLQDTIHKGIALGYFNTAMSSGTEQFTGVRLDSEGRVVAVGSSDDGGANRTGLLARFAADLSGLDPAFNAGSATPGYYVSDTGSFGGNGYEQFDSVALDDAGLIVVSGMTAVGGVIRPMIARFDGDGAAASVASEVLAINGNLGLSAHKATGVATLGAGTRAFAASTQYVNATRTQGVLFAVDSAFNLDAAFNADGEPTGAPGYQLGGDTSFLGAAIPLEGFHAAALDPDQLHVYVAGYSTDSEHTGALLVRYSISGELE